MMHSNHNPDSMIKDGQNRTGQRKNCLYTQIDTYNLIHTQLLLPIFISTDLHPFYIYFRNGRAAAAIVGHILLPGTVYCFINPLRYLFLFHLTFF